MPSSDIQNDVRSEAAHHRLGERQPFRFPHSADMSYLSLLRILFQRGRYLNVRKNDVRLLVDFSLEQHTCCGRSEAVKGRWDIQISAADLIKCCQPCIVALNIWIRERIRAVKSSISAGLAHKSWLLLQSTLLLNFTEKASTQSPRRRF